MTLTSFILLTILWVSNSGKNQVGNLSLTHVVQDGVTGTEGSLPRRLLPSIFGTFIFFGLSIWLNIKSHPPGQSTWLGPAITWLSQDSQTSCRDWLVYQVTGPQQSILKASGKIAEFLQLSLRSSRMSLLALPNGHANNKV